MNRIHLKPAATLREPNELVAHGLARVADLPDLEKVAARYAVAVTPDIAALIDPDDPNDPIARQFIPGAEELVTEPNENPDPIGDQAYSPVAGIVHRYPDRVLFKLVHVCAVYCRFCFRREMVGPGKATAMSDTAYRNALGYIRGHAEIWEVILTGGDPLMLSPRRLAEIMADLAGNFTRMGDVGAGQTTKMINQAIVGAGFVVMAEALALAERSGIDAAALPDCLAGGFAESALLKRIYPQMQARAFDPPKGYSRQLLKDLHALSDFSTGLGLTLPMAEVALAQYQSHVDDGNGERDTASIIDRYEKR